MSNYRRGRAKEYRTAEKLREEGWTVLRTAGSHGEFDLIAIKTADYLTSKGAVPMGLMRLVQCKSGRSQERAIKEVLRTGIKRYEGLYSVAVEVV